MKLIPFILGTFSLSFESRSSSLTPLCPLCDVISPLFPLCDVTIKTEGPPLRGAGTGKLSDESRAKTDDEESSEKTRNFQSDKNLIFL